MMIKAPYLILAIGMAALVSMASTCDRDKIEDDDDDQDSAKGVVVINSPASNATFAYEDTVWIRGYVSHPGKLHGYEIKVGTESDKEVYYNVERHLHGSHIDFNEWFVNRASANTNAILHVEGELGHGEGHFERDIVLNLRKDL